MSDNESPLHRALRTRGKRRPSEAEIRDAEAEECAKIADKAAAEQHAGGRAQGVAEYIASAIRARIQARKEGWEP